MQWIPCSMFDSSGFYAAWPKASRLNAVDCMHCDWMQCTPCSVVKCIRIECNGLHAGCLNAVDVMQHGPRHPDWMQWIACIVIDAVYSMQRGQMHPDWMQRIPCTENECSGFHAAWRNGTLLNAVDFIQHDWMQWIPCSKLNAVYFMQYGPKHTYRTQWIPCILSVWNVIHAAL